MPLLGSHVYSKISLWCIEGTNLSFTGSYECALHLSLEVFSVIAVILSCAQKANYRVLAGLSVVSMFWYVGWCISDRKGQEPDVLIFLSSLERIRVLSFSGSCEIWSLHESFPAVTSSLHNLSTLLKLVDKSQELGFLDAMHLLMIIPKLVFR